MESPPKRPLQICLELFGLALVLAVFILGWRELWFLCDDAYIAFRFVDQAALGRGLVWNPAPFVPVEGYTSFLWVAILLVVRLVSGLDPPVVANWLALAAGLATLALLARELLRAQLRPEVEQARSALAFLALLGYAANRTVVTWASSGLETALFVLLLAWWVVEGLRRVESRGDA